MCDTGRQLAAFTDFAEGPKSPFPFWLRMDVGSQHRKRISYAGSEISQSQPLRRLRTWVTRTWELANGVREPLVTPIFLNRAMSCSSERAACGLVFSSALRPIFLFGIGVQA